MVPRADEVEATLDTASEYDELWCLDKEWELPRFVRLPGPDGEPRPVKNIRTLIAIPISRGSATNVLVYFESPNRLAASDGAKAELELITRSISRLYDLQVQNREAHLATSNELAELDEICRIEHDFGDVSTLILFWAYAERGDSEVLAVLERVLQTAASTSAFGLFDWQRNVSGERVPAQIEEQIRAARFFVAYLSTVGPG